MITYPPEVLKEIKDHLSEERKKIELHIAELSKQDPFSDTDRLNDNAALDMEATEETDHERLQAMITELTAQLKDIDGALERIAKGTYGHCVSCGKLIDTERLAAMPTATLCMDCQKNKQQR